MWKVGINIVLLGLIISSVASCNELSNVEEYINREQQSYWYVDHYFDEMQENERYLTIRRINAPQCYSEYCLAKGERLHWGPEEKHGSWPYISTDNVKYVSFETTDVKSSTSNERFTSLFFAIDDDLTTQELMYVRELFLNLKRYYRVDKCLEGIEVNLKYDEPEKLVHYLSSMELKDIKVLAKFASGKIYTLLLKPSAENNKLGLSVTLSINKFTENTIVEITASSYSTL